MEDAIFPHKEILQFINEDLDMKQFTMEDLKNPTASFVQLVYIRFLQDFGFNTSALLVPSMELMESLDHPEVLKEMIPTLSLQAACHHLICKLVNDQSFGIMDLLRPSVKRTQSFFSVLQNFWLFVNQRIKEVDRLVANVEGKVEERVRLEARIEDFKARINQRRSKAVEDRATEDALVEDIEELKRTLEELTGKREVLDGEKLEVEQKLASLAANWEEMDAKKTSLTKEIATLQGVFEGAAIMDRLDQEIAQLNEHLEIKETRKVEFRNNLEVLERSKEEYGAALELIRAISREGERMRELVGKLREQSSKMEGVKMDMDELESELREAQQQVGERKAELAKVRLQGDRRRRGKEEELVSERRAVEEAKQQLGEEQLAVVELVNQIRDVKLMEEEEALEMGREATTIRAHYAKILEAVQKFNQKINNDFKIIEEAQIKMAAPPAL